MQKKLKPKVEGSIVRDENRIPLPAEGKDVTMTPYWERRLREEDVEEVKTPSFSAPTKKNADEKGDVK